VGPGAFRRIHDRLLAAYFEESRDISADDTLRALWAEVGLPEGDFERRADPALLERVLAEHAEALAMGANGVPAVRQDGVDAVVTGALPYEAYVRWAARIRERRNAATSL